MPMDSGEYRLDPDASNTAIGAVLSQVQDGEERVIAYASRTLSRPEKNYCVTRRELLAIVYFVKQFRSYLLGREFLIRTDHSALRWLKLTPEPIGQQARWLERLEEYSYKIEHRAGNKHTNADALSRRPCRQCDRYEDEDEDAWLSARAEGASGRRSPRFAAKMVILNVGADVEEEEVVKRARLYEEDADLGEVFAVMSGSMAALTTAEVGGLGPAAKVYHQELERMKLIDGRLYRVWES